MGVPLAFRGWFLELSWNRAAAGKVSEVILGKHQSALYPGDKLGERLGLRVYIKAMSTPQGQYTPTDSPFTSLLVLFTVFVFMLECPCYAPLCLPIFLTDHPLQAVFPDHSRPQLPPTSLKAPKNHLPCFDLCT